MGKSIMKNFIINNSQNERMKTILKSVAETFKTNQILRTEVDIYEHKDDDKVVYYIDPTFYYTGEKPLHYKYDPIRFGFESHIESYLGGIPIHIEIPNLVKATVNEQHEDVSKMMDRIIDHTGIREIYPMIGKVIVKEIEPLNSVFFLFQLNDPSIDGENMYKKGFDPHYLIDRHLKNYLGLFGFKNKKVGYIVAASDGEVIDTYVV